MNNSNNHNFLLINLLIVSTSLSLSSHLCFYLSQAIYAFYLLTFSPSLSLFLLF